MFKYILSVPLLFLLFSSSPDVHAKEDPKIKCRLNIKKFIQYENEYKMTFYINDEKNGYNYMFGTDLAFHLPLTNNVYNYNKTAYILGKDLCIQYWAEGNTNRITRMFDDYIIDEISN